MRKFNDRLISNRPPSSSTISIPPSYISSVASRVVSVSSYSGAFSSGGGDCSTRCRFREEEEEEEEEEEDEEDDMLAFSAGGPLDIQLCISSYIHTGLCRTAWSPPS